MRNNRRLIWTSSYDRGLEHLLDIWPEVKKAVPEAELVITYGWNLFKKAYPDNPERLAWMDSINKKMDQPGIAHLGRVGQAKMVELLQECGIWAYPTDFDEISCISAMKAQVYGAIPVTMNRAALAETVQYGSKLNGDIFDPIVLKSYTDDLIPWLKDDERQNETRKLMQPWAVKEYNWSGVAKAWDEEFKSPIVLTKDQEAEFKEHAFSKLVPDMEASFKEVK